ncbi:MAG: glycosyltransferase [Candidatus Pacearchaeota archaeon]
MVPKKMKVAFIVGDFPDEIGSFVSDQIDEIVKSGIDVSVFAVRESKKPFAKKFLDNCSYRDKIHFVNVPTNMFLRYLKASWLILTNLFTHPGAIFRALSFKNYKTVALTLMPLYFKLYFLNRKNNFDIIHAHFGQRGIYGAAIKEEGIKGKLITSFYGGDLSYFVKKTNQRVYDILIKEGSLFLPLSSNFKEIWVNLGGPKNKTQVHRVGVDLSNFAYFQRPSKKQIDLLMIARFVEKKGHIYGVEAFSEIVKTHPQVKLTLAGDGPLLESIKQLVKKLNIEDKVDFIGKVSTSQLPELYRSADIYLLPSVTASDGDKEGTPVSLMEAGATGLPIVSTTHSGIPEVVVNGKTGFLVNEKDSKALAENLSFLISNPLKRIEMGKAGQKFVQENYEKKRQAEKLLSLYRSIIANK